MLNWECLEGEGEETEEEVDGCDKGRHVEGWCWGRRGGRQEGV